MNRRNLFELSRLKFCPPLAALFCLGAVLLRSGSLLAQNPSCPVPIVPCSGNGQSSTIKFLVGGVPQNDVTVHVGDTLFYQVTVAVPADQSCAATNVDAFLGFPDGTSVQFLSHACIGANGTANITCPGNPACINSDKLKYTVGTVANDVGKAFFLTEPNGLPGSGTNICFVSPSANRVGAVLNAVGVSVGTTAVNTYSSCNNITALVINPCIACTKTCANAIGEAGAITFSGTVRNCGTHAGTDLLSNITVSNLVNGVLTLLTNISQLDAGQSASFSGSYSNPDVCAPITDRIFVGGTDTATGPYNRTITSDCSATCSNILSPCIRVTKNCDPHSVPVGGTVTFTGIVTNCGNVALTNVVLNDTFLGRVIATFPRLERGGTAGSSQPYSATYVATAADCARGTLTNTVIATGRDLCNRTTVQDTASCTFSVICPPCIRVTKEVACFLGPNAQGADSCDTFRKFAIGVQGTHADGTVQEPAFCFRITVTNCSTTVGLTNVTVIDDHYGNFTANFPCVAGVFAPGASCTFEFKVEAGTTDTIGTFVTNTVTASGQSALTGEGVSDVDRAAIEVVPAKLVCQKFYTIDGGPFTNHVTLSDSGTHTVVWYVTIMNTGLANLLDLTVTDTSTGPGCNSVVPLRELDAGTSTTFPICTNASFSCGTSKGVDNTITIVANAFSFGTNTHVCAHDIRGTNITASTECSALLSCVTPAICRVTGGGRQDLNDGGEVCPADARYVTHGGQVGAPVGNKVCVIDTSLPNYFLGNPCIHGRWTHVRHQAGGGEGNFHARFFDTLDCACLDTNLDANCHYGAGTVVDGVCNPGDRLSGPEPRRAPANKIAFTGVGDWQCEKGGREPRACLFRVDIEDRGEPGNDHALDLGHKPGRTPDRYRIRIWVLTPAEKAQLLGGGADPYLIHFRDCISACNGIDYQDGVCGPNSCSGDTCTGLGTTGTITFPGGCPVRSPNIDDGGELLHGNHQIHPSIKECDPANPTGPGLAKP